jgi:RNA 2',3'-cyclic 3'-phosphodiesterase
MRRGTATSAAEQMSLGGFERAALTDRLFLAVLPDPATAARITALAEGLRQRQGLRGAVLRAARLHVTLFHLGDHSGVRQDIVVAAREAADKIDASAFDVCFDSAASFRSGKNKRPFVLRCPRDETLLYTFRSDLGVRLIGAGLGDHVKGAFTPHVTLLYDEQIVGTMPIEPVRWRVRELVLIHSLIGQTVHRVIGRWPLR